MLLVGTGLLGRSLLALLAVNPGFAPEHLLTLEIQSTGSRYDDDAAVWRYHDRVRDAVASIPGVVAAEVTTQLPLGGNFDGNGVAAQDKPLANPELAPSGQRYAVSTGYLRTMRIPLVQGRDFTEADVVDSASRVIILSAALVRRIWPGEDAVGKRVRIGGDDRPWMTVIGVCGDVRHTGLETTDLSGFYVPERQWYWADDQVVLVVRTAGDPAALAASVVRAVRSIDSGQPIVHVRTGSELIATSTARRRLAVTLFATFGIVATLLSAAGVYGVLAGAVAERRREIGIRSALGATPRAIVNLVLRQGLALAGAGLVLGLAGALALSRYLRTMLFGIEPTDPVTLTATAVLLITVALGACLVPAWRAMRVDPVTALRAE
jgi:predicted permease